MREEIQEAQIGGYYQNQRSEMLPFVPTKAKHILEVGCGEGRFSQLVQSQLSVEAWGVEIDERAAKVASQSLNRVLCQPFNAEIALPKNYFDCIIFNDVLEHLVDPFSALDFSRKLLSANGVVVCSIPNIRFFHTMVELLFEGEWRYRSEGILDRTHLRFFTNRSIKRTFHELGYCIEQIEGLHPTPSWKYRLVNTLLFGQITDMSYPQFAVVARPNN
jgi:2-polyprenyl-3-methyl-5-hydroxy-6-metoxy-1,4-benzoquinol methylase